MSETAIHAYVIDDEASIRVAYARLLRSAAMQPHTFASVEDFMSSDFTDDNACVVCDVQFPGKGGLELPALLQRAGHRLPIIFVTGQDNEESRNVAKRFCAAGFYRKPVDGQDLIEAIACAVQNRR